MEDTLSQKTGCWLTDHAGIPVPPTKNDFIVAGNLKKRRGGFGKMSQQKWKKRYFVLLKTHNLCYFEDEGKPTLLELLDDLHLLSYDFFLDDLLLISYDLRAGSFDSVDFCHPPRGIMTIDDDVLIVRSTKTEVDNAGGDSLAIQGGAQRWKLTSDLLGELNCWEKALRSLVKEPNFPVRTSTRSFHLAAGIDPSSTKAVAKAIRRGSGSQQLTPARSLSSTNGGLDSPPPPIRSAKAKNTVDVEQSGSLMAFVCALAVVDAVCYLLYTQKASLEVFYAAMLMVNVVIGLGVLRRSGRHKHGIGVPLIHQRDVGPLRVALKKIFPIKKDLQPPLLGGNIGETASGVPTAGSTMQQYDGALGKFPAPQHSWCNGTNDIFRVRGKGYMQDKIKVVPEQSLYEMVGMDTFSTEARINNMASEMNLESISNDLPQVAVPGVPPLLVINVQVPSASPMLTSSAEDGPGYQCVFYFRLKKSTVHALEDLETASEGVRLWVEYCKHLELDDDFHGRFKCIAVIADCDDVILPNFVTKYNGKPVLINKSGSWVKRDNYIENTINVHRFSFIAKRSLHSLKGTFKGMVLHLGFTIEGRAAEELPESLLACSTLNYPQLDSAVEFDI